MIYITSDTHFWHMNRYGGIIAYCNRPYGSIVEMNEGIIKNWNEIVQPTDTVYHLGDFAFCGTTKLKEILLQLNGMITLIKGNHDYEKKEKYLSFGFTDVLPYEKIDQFFLTHYPIYRPEDLEKDLGKRELADSEHTRHCYQKVTDAFKESCCSIVLHGHTHDKMYHRDDLLHVNISVDANNYRPVSLDDIRKRFTFVEKGI